MRTPNTTTSAKTVTKEIGGTHTTVQIDPFVPANCHIKNAGSWANIEGGERLEHDMVTIDALDSNGNAVRVHFPLSLLPVTELSDEAAMRLLMQVRKAREAGSEG